MRPTKPIMALGAFAVGTVALAGPALAYFTVNGQVPEGYARAAKLNAPSVSGARVLSGIVSLTVGASPGFKPEGYRIEEGGVTRCVIHDGDGGSCLRLGVFLGTRTFSVRAFAGNWTSAPATCTFKNFIFDTCNSNGALNLGLNLAATTPILSVKDDLGVSSSDGITNITEVKLLGTAVAKSTIILFAEGEEIGRGVASDEGTYAIDVRLAEGVHHLTALTTYEGDSSPYSSEATITVDVTAPKIEVNLDAKGEDWTVSGKAGTAPGDRSDLKVVASNGAEVSGGDPSKSGSFAAEVDGPAGTRVTVSQSDVAGNKSSESVTLKKAEEPKKEDPKPATEPKPAEPKSEAPKSEEPKKEEPKATEPAPASSDPATPAQP